MDKLTDCHQIGGEFLQEPPIGFCRSHQLVSAGATNWFLQKPQLVSAGATNRFLQEPPIGFCRSHQLVSAGATNWFLQEPPIGFCRSHQLVSAGATNWFLQEPPIGFCRSHQFGGKSCVFYAIWSSKKRRKIFIYILFFYEFNYLFIIYVKSIVFKGITKVYNFVLYFHLVYYLLDY